MISRRHWLAMMSSVALPSLAPGWLEAGERSSEPGVTFLAPGTSGHEAARALYNSRLNLHPRLVASCTSEAGVQSAVLRARELGVSVSIKSGGHGLAGFSVVDDSLLVDVGRLKAPQLDADGTLHTGPGLRLAELNALLLPRGRLLPAGSCGGVAVGGLALGGGYGFFSREHGLTCDHLQALRMVDASGKLQDVSGNSALLRACRGGGNGNFGVVTNMRFSTVPAPASFSIARIRFAPASSEAMVSLAKRWMEFSLTLPAYCYSAWVANGKALTVLVTSTRPLSKDLGLKQRLAKFSDGASRVEPVVEEPTQHAVKRFYGQPGPLPFRNASAGFYEHAEQFLALAPEILGRVRSHAGLIFQLNTFGPFPDALPGAFAHRQARWIGEIQAYWSAQDRPARAGELQREVEAVLRTLAQGGVHSHYANYADPAIQVPLQSYYGSALPELRSVKRALDPDNRFRHPQSVEA